MSDSPVVAPSFVLPIVTTDDPPPPPVRRLPPWLRQNLGPGGGHAETAHLLAELGLETVCSSAKCPNRLECWSQRTATFMILGNVCTRPCGFCSVPTTCTRSVRATSASHTARASAASPPSSPSRSRKRASATCARAVEIRCSVQPYG